MTIDRPNDEQTPKSPATATPDTAGVSDAVRALLNPENAMDPRDKTRVAGALAYIDAPTGRWEDVSKHASNVGEVMGGYYMQGGEPPAEVEELNRAMQALQCECKLAAARAALDASPRDINEVSLAVRFAIDLSTTFKKGYGDDRYLVRAEALRAEVEAR